MATLQCSRCGGTRYDTNHRCEKGCGMMTASSKVKEGRVAPYRREGGRDELSPHVDRLHRVATTFTQIQEERDALAAHVERLRKALVTCHNAHDDYYIEQHEVVQAIDDAPAISLARRDARVKAEALEDFADSDIGGAPLCGADARVGRWCVDAAKRRAAEYRQQAEAEQ